MPIIREQTLFVCDMKLTFHHQQSGQGAAARQTLEFGANTTPLVVVIIHTGTAEILQERETKRTQPPLSLHW